MLGVADAEEILPDIIDIKFSCYPEGLLKLLMMLDSKFDYPADSKQRDCEECVKAMIARFPDALSRWKELPEYRREYQPAAIREKAIVNLFRLFWRADAMDIADCVPQVFDQFPEAASLNSEVPKALVMLRDIREVFHLKSYLLLWQVSAGYLLGRSETPPEEPRDMTTTVELACSCSQCEALQEFCNNSEKRIERFPL